MHEPFCLDFPPFNAYIWVAGLGTCGATFPTEAQLYEHLYRRRSDPKFEHKDQSPLGSNQLEESVAFARIIQRSWPKIKKTEKKSIIELESFAECL